MYYVQEISIVKVKQLFILQVPTMDIFRNNRNSVVNFIGQVLYTLSTSLFILYDDYEIRLFFIDVDSISEELHVI